ncbi:TIGR02391 family protein [Isoptericola nanjingensis]|uniref:TIGR02391 family protein n=1 Tax=Isoptericola nanjingensis TaxID=903413 RepID=UPI003D210AEE
MSQNYDVDWVRERLGWWINETERILRNAQASRTVIAEDHISALRAREAQTREIVAHVLDQPESPLITRGPTGHLRIAESAAICKYALGKAETDAETRQHLGTRAPAMAADSLHPSVWAAASQLWSSEHYRQAVQNAATVLNADVQKRVGRRDVSDQSLMTEVLRDGAPQPGKPRLRWPGEDSDQTVKAMRDGIRAFAQGCFMAIRNPSTHGTDEMPRQEAFEQLASLSTLARWIDQCQLVTAKDTTKT